MRPKTKISIPEPSGSEFHNFDRLAGIIVKVKPKRKVKEKAERSKRRKAREKGQGLALLPLATSLPLHPFPLRCRFFSGELVPGESPSRSLPTHRALFDDAVLVLNTEQKREVAELVENLLTSLKEFDKQRQFWMKRFSELQMDAGIFVEAYQSLGNDDD